MSTAPVLKVTGLAPFTMRLTRARMGARSGEGLLYGASILAAAVSAAIALTIAGGTWMFLQRALHPSGIHAEIIAADRTFRGIIGFYVGLAVFACALVIAPLLSLSSSGAQLGARGRERRLAALRLLGLSSGDVTRMAMLDALIQAVIGTVIGLVTYLVTLPLWGGLSFQAMRIRPAEMLLPWWLLVTICVLLVAMSVGASAWGLRQVRISPLGISRRSNQPAAKPWRLVVAAVLIVGALAGTQALKLTPDGPGIYLLAGTSIAIFVGITTLGPLLVQTLARLMVPTPWPALRTAGRRIIANPRATWGRTAAMGLLAFVGGFLAIMPIAYTDNRPMDSTERTFVQEAGYDFTTGAIITIVAGFVLTATSLLINQASSTLERAEQSRALHRMGAPSGFAMRVMWLETFLPLVTSTAVGAILGGLLASPIRVMVDQSGMNHGNGMVTMTAAMLGGLAIAGLALAASHPLQRRVVGAQERKND